MKGAVNSLLQRRRQDDSDGKLLVVRRWPCFPTGPIRQPRPCFGLGLLMTGFGAAATLETRLVTLGFFVVVVVVNVVVVGVDVVGVAEVEVVAGAAATSTLGNVGMFIVEPNRVMNSVKSSPVTNPVL